MFYLLDSVLVSNIKLVQHELNLFIFLLRWNIPSFQI